MKDKIMMQAIKELAEQIQMPEAVIQQVGAALEQLPPEALRPFVETLTGPRWTAGWTQLKTELGEDSCGMKMLACMLWAAVYSREKYAQAGILEPVFTDTMKCFTRFVREHKASYGCWGFDRDFWTGRQLSLQLFRLGELEYEKVIDKEERKVSIHIPSDADLSPEKCRESIQLAEAFFKKYAPGFDGVPYICESWLLSPALKELLPKTSRILRFQELFELYHVNWEDRSFMAWVFSRGALPIQELPQNTSLQKRMKQYLMEGGLIGEAAGRLRPLPDAIFTDQEVKDGKPDKEPAK